MKGGLSERQRQLINDHWWLINRWKRTLTRRASHLPLSPADQIHDVTTDALVEAARTFDRRRGPFAPWVARLVDLRWRAAMRQQWRRSHAQVNGWSFMAWYRRSTEWPQDEAQERALVIDPVGKAAMAHMLGLVSEHSLYGALSPEHATMLVQLRARVEELLVKMRTALSPSHEQVIRLVDLRPDEPSWVQIASEIGINKRTAQKRREEALAWISSRLKET